MTMPSSSRVIVSIRATVIVAAVLLAITGQAAARSPGRDRADEKKQENERRETRERSKRVEASKRAEADERVDADEREPSAPSTLALPFEEHTLGNGLRILTLEDHSVPAVTYWTWFRVGSINERPGLTGISHLFEHLMFRGAKKYGPGEFDKTLERNGGYSNAFTDKDMTAYYEDVISSALDLVVDLDADRMASLNVTREVLDPEREVVKEERRLRVDNSIVGSIDEVLDSTAYLAHPYHWPVVGWMKDLDNITVDDCHDYFRTYYAPNNATIIVVGDFRTADLVASIDRLYRNIPRQTPPREVVDAEPPSRGLRRAQLWKKAEAETLGMAFQAPPVDAPGFYAVELLQHVLGSGRSSRLYQRLVYDAQVATDVTVFNEWRRQPGLFKIYVDMKPGRKASEGEALVNEELAKLRDAEISDTELQKAKNNVRATFVRQMKTNRGKGEVAGQFEILWGYWSKQKDFLPSIDAVTTDDIRTAAARFLVDTNASIVTLVPEEPPKRPEMKTPLGKEDEDEEDEEDEPEGEGHETGEAEEPPAGVL